MWVAFYVGIGVLGIAVLAVAGFRLYRQVRQLGRDLKAASERITTVTDELSRQSAARSPRA